MTTERKPPTPITPTRTLAKPGAIKAKLAAGETVPAGRTLLAPGEIGKHPRGRSSDAPAAAPERVAAYARGLSAESIAAALLLGKGYRILARRWRSGHGEVDIVARNRTTLVFVEVKTRGDLDSAAESVSPRQRRRIADAAATWLAERSDHGDLNVRFDVVLLAPGRLPRHIAGAFDIDG